MAFHSIAEYARDLRPHLPPAVFRPAPARLLWLPLHAAVAAACIWLIATGTVGRPLAAVLSIPIGLAFAGMAFVAHELLHGAIVRDLRARHILGGIAFSPFLISARHWVGWHNRLHHGHTTIAGIDP